MDSNPTTAMTRVELESHAYRVLAQIEALQNELRATNGLIADEIKKESTPTVEEKPTTEKVAEN